MARGFVTDAREIIRRTGYSSQTRQQ